MKNLLFMGGLAVMLVALPTAAEDPVWQRLEKRRLENKKNNEERQRELDRALAGWQGYIISPEWIIKCYHPSVNSWQSRIVESPWAEAERSSPTAATAQVSQVIEINYNGAFTGRRYQAIVGVVQKDNYFIAKIIRDNSPVQANRNCQLSKWTPVPGDPLGNHPAESWSNPPSE